MPGGVLSEDRARFWSTIFAGVTAVGLVAGGLYTVFQYLNSREADQRNFKLQLDLAQIQASNAKMEAKKPFFSKQLELCEKASSAAAVLATKATRNPGEVTKAAGDFWQLYWGPLGIVEGTSVEGAMVRFGNCLNGKCGERSMPALSLELAHACRDLVSESWNLNLPPLDESEKRKSAPQ